MTVARSTAGVEKRWVTAVMIDLVGSTALADTLGPERMLALIEDVIGRATRMIEASGGHSVDFAGDSVLAIFGAPVAIEAATLNACRAALRLQEALECDAADYTLRFGTVPRLRIGIADGEVVIGALATSRDQRLNALGSAVNMAARLQTLAGPGEVVCSQSVAEELAGDARIDALGERSLKGIAAPQQIFRVASIGAVTGAGDIAARSVRAASRYVGRAEERAQIADWLADGGGDTRPLCISGPPGIGKSRFLRQALDHAGQTLRIATAHCGPGDQTETLRPMFALLRAAAEADGVTGRAEIAGWLGNFFPDGTRPEPALADRIARIEPATDTASDAVTLLRQLQQVTARLAGDPARLLVIEDIHWLDPTSREVLAELNAPGAGPLRLVMTSRTETPLERHLDRVARLALAPLDTGEIADLVMDLLPDTADRRDLAKRVATRAEGNPLFAEELARHLARSDASVEETLAGASGHSGLIQNLVFSRFDKLDPADKAALKQAAIVGRVLRMQQLAAITGSTEEAERIRDVAIENQLIEPTDDGQHWRFAHVMIQDAIAASLLETEASRMHLRAAEILRATIQTAETDLAAQLAHHYTVGEDFAQALRFHVQAAKNAWQVYALYICLDHLRAAETLLLDGHEPESEAVLGDFVMTYARVLDVVGYFTEAITMIDNHRPRLEKLSDSRLLTRALCLQAKALIHTARFDEAARQLDTATALAEAQGDADGLAVARVIRLDLQNDVIDGATPEAEALFAQTSDYAQSGRDPHIAQLRLYEMSAYYRQRGDLDAALAKTDEMIALGQATNDSRALAYGNWARAAILLMIERPEDGLAAARASKTHSLPGTMDQLTAHVFELLARLMLNDQSVTNAELDEIATNRLARGDRTVAVMAAFNSAALHFMQGRVRAALATLAEAEGHVRAGIERGLLLQFLIKKAEIHLTVAGQYPPMAPPPRIPLREIPAAIGLRLRAVRMAEACYDEIEALLDVPAMFHRARISLGRGLIARARRKPDAAKAHLAEALAWFDANGPANFRDMTRGFLG